MMKSN